MKETKVIAISAVSGGGKTTVVDELSRRLRSSAKIYFDDYDFEECPQNFFQWVKDGADYNEWNLESLARDIEKIIEKGDKEYLLLDYPFAYKNDRIAPMIHHTIFIDTPLDIAMARRILRDSIGGSMDELERDLKGYLKRGRIAYLEAQKTIKPDSDIIVSGNMEVDEIVDEILGELEGRR